MTDQVEENTAFPRPGVHGRRKGKKLRSHHSYLMENMLPRVSVDPATGLDGFVSTLPNPERELWLEIGFGGGEHLASRAHARPDIDFVGCEPFQNGVAKLLAEIASADLSNIKIFPDDASKLLERLPAQSVEKVFLLFPDPWPKRRQKKRRFLNEINIASLARVIRFGGEFRFATDIDDYAGWALARLLKSPFFDWVSPSAVVWSRPWEGHTVTRYESWALEQGRQPVYLTFARNRFEEPAAAG